MMNILLMMRRNICMKVQSGDNYLTINNLLIIIYLGVKLILKKKNSNSVWIN